MWGDEFSSCPTTMAATVNAEARIEKMVARILTEAHNKEARKIEAWKKPTDDIRRLVRHDYVRSLRRNLPYRELKTLMVAFSELLPGFNREVVGMMPIDRLASFATTLNLHFKASPNAGEDGLALRGFYVTRKDGILKRPLIYVNTAHHPIAVSSTFCHEVGHHMSSELLGGDKETPVHFFFDADYASHLEEPSELAADAMVSIAGYPEPVARKIFATPWKWGLVARAKDMTEAALAEVRGHLKKAYGFDVMELIAANQRLHYLSGMIHYAKLRWALLAEYDI
jgi:hypothetical protein